MASLTPRLVPRTGLLVTTLLETDRPGASFYFPEG
jgi:hypothetical protein